MSGRIVQALRTSPPLAEPPTHKAREEDRSLFPIASGFVRTVCGLWVKITWCEAGEGEPTCRGCLRELLREEVCIKLGVVRERLCQEPLTTSDVAAAEFVLISANESFLSLRSAVAPT